MFVIISSKLWVYFLIWCEHSSLCGVRLFIAEMPRLSGWYGQGYAVINGFYR